MKLSDVYECKYENKNTSTVIITLSIGRNYLKSPILNISSLCIKENKKSLFLFNIGSTCKKIYDIVSESKINNIIVFGSGYSAYAAILWSGILNRIFKNKNKEGAVRFICIEPYLDVVKQVEVNNITGSIYSAIKPYIDFNSFIKKFGKFIRGTVYVSKDKNKTYFDDLYDIEIFQVNFYSDDMNYFMKKSVSVSLNFNSIVYAQCKSKNRIYNFEMAKKCIYNNIPSVKTLCKISNLQKDSFIRSNLFNMFSVSNTKYLFVITNISQYFNAISWIDDYKIKDEFVIIVQYTFVNINMPQLIYENFLKQREKYNMNILFFEIPLSNKVSFNGYLYFEVKYNNLLSVINPEIVVLTSMENRTAILGNLSKKYSLVYLLEEGLGTYLQIQKFKNPKTYNTALHLKPYEYHEYALINCFGSKVMKESIYGFLKFDRAYITFPNVLNNFVSAEYFNPLVSYIDKHIKDIFKVQKSLKIDKKNGFIIYIDQVWGFPNIDFYSSIFKILLRNCNGKKILFQLSPKNIEYKDEVIRLIKKLGLEDVIIIFDFDILYKVEFLVSILNPDAVYSLCSSALIYLKVISPNIPRFSIAKSLLLEINNSDTYLSYSVACKRFNEAYQALLLIENITDTFYENKLGCI
ncbi:polysialyltransferase family glycosyltransferase [Psychrobacter sp. I-STPA6b]|uniref:polysialyltransferase family glycosyltransferase n=1 Tax=Psychrobacter sp. I-STPA6b TaxID=2585718 RepID=UPI001D0C0C71|nr:polysialyltransferase family glycosyltransferase [Psychrobacter sp. I-STPA6b]